MAAGKKNNNWLRLFYCNKSTGIIEYGFVVMEEYDRFLFKFGNKTKWLGYDVLGKRLFFTYEGARKNYKRETDDV